MSEPLVSVIVCSHNGGWRIGHTLETLARQTAEPAWELLVIDNASTDSLADTVRTLWPATAPAPLRVIAEPRKGQVHARNTGLAAARGKIILFTDDDVLVPPDWVQDMASPMLGGEADAVVGRIVIPPSRRPQWMTGDWPAYFSSTEHYGDPPPELVGACMGFTRKVLEQVPGFDPALGPGALGFYDDTLFAAQLVVAGFRLRFLTEVRVEHHFDLDRLQLDNLRNFARSHGRSRAYADYHWRHVSAGRAWRHRLGWLKALAKIRLRAWLRGASDAVPDQREMNARMCAAYWNYLYHCRSTPRRYAHLALRPLDG